MIDADIKRSAEITQDRMLKCVMMMPLDGIIINSESWMAFGEFMKIQGEAEDVLTRMIEFIRRAKGRG